MTTTSTPTVGVLRVRRAELLEGIEEDVDAIVDAIADLRKVGAQQTDLRGTATDYQDLRPIARYIAAKLYAAFPEIEHSGTFGFPSGFDHQADLATHDAGTPPLSEPLDERTGSPA